MKLYMVCEQSKQIHSFYKVFGYTVIKNIIKPMVFYVVPFLVAAGVANSEHPELYKTNGF